MKRSAIWGAGSCAIALAFILVDPRAALAGWLCGFAFWAGIGLGGLGLLMMIRLIPGSWQAELGPYARLLAGLVAPAVLAALPLLIGTGGLYDWMHQPQHGYRAVYLSWPGFALRTVILLSLLAVLGALILTRPAKAVALSAGGIVLFVLFDTALATDWLMSLDSRFHSSGFGLYVMSIQMNSALAMIIIMRLAVADGVPRAGLLGSLMLCGLLLWAYFAFMQYFIIWSDNLPAPAHWYQNRSEGGWALVEYAGGALGLVPLFLLLFPPVRGSRRWLLALSGAILAGKILEMGWLVLPTLEHDLSIGIVAAALSLAGLGLLSWFAVTRSAVRAMPQVAS